MHVGERIGDLGDDAPCFALGQWPAAKTRRQRFAAHVRHHVVAESRHLTENEERHHPGVLEPRGQSRLLQKAPRRLRVARCVGLEHLDRHFAIEQPIAAEPDDAHAPFAKRSEEVEGDGEMGAQVVGERGGCHGAQHAVRRCARPPVRRR